MVISISIKCLLEKAVSSGSDGVDLSVSLQIVDRLVQHPAESEYVTDFLETHIGHPENTLVIAQLIDVLVKNVGKYMQLMLLSSNKILDVLYRFMKDNNNPKDQRDKIMDILVDWDKSFPHPMFGEFRALLEKVNIEECKCSNKSAPDENKVSRVLAIYDFKASEEDELTFFKGDIINVVEHSYKDWWRGELRGNIGLFPKNYVESLLGNNDIDKKIGPIYDFINKMKPTDACASSKHKLDLENLYREAITKRPDLIGHLKYLKESIQEISTMEKQLESSIERYNMLHRQRDEPHVSRILD